MCSRMIRGKLRTCHTCHPCHPYVLILVTLGHPCHLSVHHALSFLTLVTLYPSSSLSPLDNLVTLLFSLLVTLGQPCYLSLHCMSPWVNAFLFSPLSPCTSSPPCHHRSTLAPLPCHPSSSWSPLSFPSLLRLVNPFTTHRQTHNKYEGDKR